MKHHKTSKIVEELLQKVMQDPVANSTQTSKWQCAVQNVIQSLTDADFQLVDMGIGYSGMVEGWERRYGADMRVFELSRPECSRKIKLGFHAGEVLSLEPYEGDNISFTANALEYWLPLLKAYCLDLMDETVKYHVRIKDGTFSMASSCSSLYGAAAPLFRRGNADEYKIYVRDVASNTFRLINLIEGEDEGVTFEHCDLNKQQQQIMTALCGKFKVGMHFNPTHDVPKEPYEL